MSIKYGLVFTPCPKNTVGFDVKIMFMFGDADGHDCVRLFLETEKDLQKFLNDLNTLLNLDREYGRLGSYNTDFDSSAVMKLPEFKRWFDWPQEDYTDYFAAFRYVEVKYFDGHCWNNVEIRPKGVFQIQ